MTQGEVLETLIGECESDHVGLWEIVDAVRNDLGVTDPSQVRKYTLGLIRQLFAKGVQVGHPARDGRQFIPWKLSPEQATARIEKEWSATGLEPGVGEVAWFTCAEQHFEGHVAK